MYESWESGWEYGESCIRNFFKTWIEVDTPALAVMMCRHQNC